MCMREYNSEPLLSVSSSLNSPCHVVADNSALSPGCSGAPRATTDFIYSRRRLSHVITVKAGHPGSASTESIEIRFPRKQREQLRDETTTGSEIILLLKTATFEEPTNEGFNRRERNLDTELRLQVVETDDVIKLESLPKQIIEDIRGENPLVDTEKITAELIDMLPGKADKSDTGLSKDEDRTDDTEVFKCAHKGGNQSPQSISSNSQSAGDSSNPEPQYCNQCGVNLRPYNDPKFCPECGTEIIARRE